MSKFDQFEYYINRELSWLSFNYRVLEEAMDSTNPLFERLKFLSITSSNLDEFFMVRVAGLKDQVKMGYGKPDNKSGMTPKEQLSSISERTHQMMDQLYHTFYELILPELQNEGISFIRADQMNAEQEKYAETIFRERIYPVLTPMAVDASHPFPMLLNKSLNLAILLESERDNKHLFAVVEVPSLLPRYIQLPSQEGKMTFVLLENLICKYIGTLFQGNKILSVSPFRITKDADLDLDEEEAEDLLQTIQRELKKRKMGSAVRLEITWQMDQSVLDILKSSLDLEDGDIYYLQGPLDLTFLMKFYQLQGYEHLKYEEYTPQPPQDLIGEKEIFQAIAGKDILVHHPYESFDPVVHFIQQAAEDPNVLAIKQTLYRISGDSPIIHALSRAAENGKQVTVLLELKARFDEENNIGWAKKLEEAGCHVIYGLVGLKTHSKITLVVRSEKDKIRRYVHMSTGNYNDITARIYTDLGLFTSHDEIGQDATSFFNHLSGYSSTPKWNQLVTAPYGLRDQIIQLIENEISQSTPEKPGRIIAKMNALTDKEIIKALFKASSAGVQIDLIIRGICCLRPDIEGVSDNIRVRSIVGRFLEHSRIFYFQNGGSEQIYLSSADWMTRNMISRVEIMFPILQENLKERLKNILLIQLSDNVKSRILQRNGEYIRVERDDEPSIESQIYLYQEVIQNAKLIEFKTYINQLKPKTHSFRER